MFTICKRFAFSASHQLKHLPATHPCANLHGHNYEVEIELQSARLNEDGFVVDYLALAEFKNYLDSVFDHKHLNDVLGDNGVTAESIAEYLFHWCRKRWSQIVAVRVYETPKTCAEYRFVQQGSV